MTASADYRLNGTANKSELEVRIVGELCEHVNLRIRQRRIFLLIPQVYLPDLKVKVTGQVFWKPLTRERCQYSFVLRKRSKTKQTNKKHSFYFMTIQQKQHQKAIWLTIKNHDGHKAILPVVGDACALSGLCLLEFNMCYSWFLLSHVLFELICWIKSLRLMCTPLRSTETWELCVLKLVLPEDLCHLTISTGWRLRGGWGVATSVFKLYITNHNRIILYIKQQGNLTLVNKVDLS